MISYFKSLFPKLFSCQLALPFLLPNPMNNSIRFLLWAMRSLFQGWKSCQNSEQGSRIVDYRSPIVSFLRIGTVQLSKSEILNAVIGGTSNIFFFHRGCEGGDCERNYVDGLVEMFPYFPSGKEVDPFSDTVTFLNLQSDARQHAKQIEFLQNISCVSVVLICDININEYTIEILKQFTKAPGGIILFCVEALDNNDTTSNARQLRQALPNCIEITVNDNDMAKKYLN